MLRIVIFWQVPVPWDLLLLHVYNHRNFEVSPVRIISIFQSDLSANFLQFLVVQLTNIVGNKESESVPIRTIPLPGTPKYISLSCDHSQLAVSILQNGTGFISIYSVASFLSTVNLIVLLNLNF